MSSAGTVGDPAKRCDARNTLLLSPGGIDHQLDDPKAGSLRIGPLQQHGRDVIDRLISPGPSFLRPVMGVSLKLLVRGLSGEWLLQVVGSELRINLEWLSEHRV